MFKNIGYHTRLKSNNTVKVSGGSFGGDFGLETADRLTSRLFTVKVRPSGSLTFVDREGREVSLYMTVDPEITDIGRAALAEYRKEQEALREIESEKRRRVEELLDSMSNDEIIARLTRTTDPTKPSN